MAPVIYLIYLLGLFILFYCGVFSGCDSHTIGLRLCLFEAGVERFPPRFERSSDLTLKGRAVLRVEIYLL